jgi:hypothetical protein
VHFDAARVRIKLLLMLEAATVLASEGINKPEPRVVQGSLVPVLWITEAGDYAYRFGHGVAILNETSNQVAKQKDRQEAVFSLSL